MLFLIDELIPRCYFRKYCIKNKVFYDFDTKKPEDIFICKDDFDFTKDLEYKLDNIIENEQNKEDLYDEVRGIYKISDKQIKFLKGLLKQSPYNSKKPLYLLSMKEASELIDCFKNGSSKPSILNEYFDYIY